MANETRLLGSVESLSSLFIPEMKISVPFAVYSDHGDRPHLVASFMEIHRGRPIRKRPQHDPGFVVLVDDHEASGFNLIGDLIEPVRHLQ